MLLLSRMCMSLYHAFFDCLLAVKQAALDQGSMTIKRAQVNPLSVPGASVTFAAQTNDLLYADGLRLSIPVTAGTGEASQGDE